MLTLDREIEAKYEVLAAMGAGGMGTVYKVRHRHLDEIRVIKLLREGHRSDEAFTARFLREAKTAVKLRHPNIAEVIDYDVTSSGTAYIVMEYIEGLTLAQIGGGEVGRLGCDVVVGVALQVLSALETLHARGFVHRDISPDNVMLTSRDGRNVAKLIDLGIAKSVDASKAITMDGHFVGKVRYAAPEQFTGGVDPRSDIYALGVMLYELVTGAPPIAGPDYRAIIMGHLTRPPRDFAETDPGGRVPQSLRAVILKALAKEPDDRYQSATEFAAALESVVRSGDLGNRPSVPPPAKPEHASPAPEGASIAPTRPVPVLSAPDVEPSVPNLVESPAAISNAPALREADAVTTVPDITSAKLRSSGSATQPDVPRRRRAWPIVLALVAAIAALVLLQPWERWSQAPTVVPSAAPAVRSQPAAEGSALVLNGLPWAEVVEVVGADGRNRVAARPLYTPAVLAVEPGTYRVRFSNPVSRRDVTVEAAVRRGETTHCEARLDEIDAAAWLRAQP